MKIIQWIKCKLGFHSMNGKTIAPYVTECPHCGKHNYWGR